MVDLEVKFEKEFSKKFLKIKDKMFKIKILKQIKKLKQNPLLGKPMRNIRKNTRELYVKPYRISYSYYKKELVILMLDIFHKDKQ